MHPPQPPADLEQRNIIEKLADFVARNGQEFEALTKDKQRDNPKFAFLQGGEFYEYYAWKVDEARRRWQTQRPQWNNPGTPALQNPQWDHYSGGNCGQEPWPRFSRPPGPCGWSGPDPSWYLKPPPAFQNCPRLPNAAPIYPYPPGDVGDAYSNRNFGDQPHFGYAGPQGPYPPPPFPYTSESYTSSGPQKGLQQTGAELTEADIEQSVTNLKAQYDSLLSQQEVEIHQLLDQKREEAVRKLGGSMNVSWEQMNEVIQPLIEACTKENISKGKTWVVENMSESKDLSTLISSYLVARASAHQVSFDLRLHLVYLLNDLLHHCKRRGAPSHLQEMLQNLVPIVFCLAAELADEDQKTKINRVLSLWESNSYLPSEVLVKMRPPEMSKFLQGWKDEQLKPYENEIEKIKSNIRNQYATLERQHQEFADHVRRQLSSSISENQDENLSDMRPSRFGPPPPIPNSPDVNFNYWAPPNRPYNAPHQEMLGGPDMRDPHRRIPPVSGGSDGCYPCGPPMPDGSNYLGQMNWPDMPPRNWVPPFPASPQTGICNRRDGIGTNVYAEGEGHEGGHISYNAPTYERDYPNECRGYGYDEDNVGSVKREDRFPGYRPSHRPSRFSSTGGHRHDNLNEHEDGSGRTHPKHSYSSDTPGSDDAVVTAMVNQSKDTLDLIPKCDPWQLPAGLMHPLIKLCDFEFRPLDAKQLRLLAPIPPSEHLLNAIEAFYLPPSHDRTRDGEGWERLGLYEFYSKKEKARHAVEKAASGNKAEKTRSTSRRRRQHSGGSAASSPSDDNLSTKGSSENEHDRPFSRDVPSHSSRNGPPHLSYLTAYPTIAIGQAIRTGPDALTLAPPPMHCMQGQLTHNFSAYKTGTAPPSVPSQPALLPSLGPPPAGAGPPGFPNPNFLQFPPPLAPGGLPGLNQPPPPITGFASRFPSSGPGFPGEHSRFDSRRSRTRSRSLSRSNSGDSRSRDYRSHSRSRSRSRSRSQSAHSRSRSSRSRSNSHSPSRMDDDTSSHSRGYSQQRGRKRSRSSSRSGSPFGHFTSAVGPGGTGPGGPSMNPNVNAARQAAMAVAASLANSFGTPQNTNNPSWSGNSGPQTFHGNPPLLPFGDGGGMNSYYGSFPGPPHGMNVPRGGGFGGAYGGPPPFGRGGCNAGGNIRYPGPDDRFHSQAPRDFHRR